jgi:hypothetical protein
MVARLLTRGVGMSAEGWNALRALIMLVAFIVPQALGYLACKKHWFGFSDRNFPILWFSWGLLWLILLMGLLFGAAK